MRFVTASLLLVLLASLAPAASGQGVTFMNYSGSAFDDRIGFQQIGVTRGASSYAYGDNEVIMPSLNRINNIESVTLFTPDGPTKDANAFLRDNYLNTGLLLGVGDGSSLGPNDQWTLLTFDSPIVNSDGPDGFVATLQFLWVAPNLSPLILSASAGHSQVMPGSGGFNGSVTDPLEDYSYVVPVATPADLVNNTPVPSGSVIRPTWVVQTFDLSAMGIAPGASVSQLYVQDWSGNGNTVELMFIAGFPPVPEPGSLWLLAAATVALVGVTRRKSRGCRGTPIR